MKKTFLLILISCIPLMAKPLWIDNPSVDGVIGGVGMSKDSNPANKRQIAIISARANLAENIRVEIVSSFKHQTKVENGKVNDYSEQLIEQKAQEVLKNSKIKELYEENDGSLYAWVVIEKP